MIDTGLGKKIVVVLVALAIIVLLVYLISRWAGVEKEKVPTEVQKVPEETRSVTLFYASRQADRMLSEAREIAVGEGLEEQVKAVITELIKGPGDRDKVSSIPEETKVMQVFWVEDTQTIFIDFNRDLVSKHPGGSTGEYYTISMIIRTIEANFPQVRRVQFLVDGYPVETIAGHYAVDKPLDVLRWR